MPRGQQAKVGDTFTNQNGYKYTKIEDRGWISAQQLLAEEILGRHLEPGDLVRIPDKTKRSNPTKDDIVITLAADRRQGSVESKKRKLEAEIADVEDKLAFLKSQLAELQKEESNAGN